MALVKVTFYWDDKYGFCYDCDRPAAFFIGGKPTDTSVRCAVCAANDAAAGETVSRIDGE